MDLDKEVFRHDYQKVLDSLDVNKETGLSQSEAEKRFQKYGPNSLKQKSQISPFKIFADQFKNILVILLLIASGFSFFIGDTIEAIAIGAVIILNALFGFVTEYRAEKSVEELKKMITTDTKVLRDGEVKNIKSKNVVPGDIVIIEEGDRITADGRLIEADNLACDESSLTGESESVSKHIDKIEKEDVPLAETKNMVYMGTAVTRGNGELVVTGTGQKTEMGKISDLLNETVDEETPLEEKLDQLGKSLIVITLIITAIIALVGIISGRDIVDMVKTGIALAIAAVPEGLPAVATITLAIGMRVMARHNALVKSLPAVETLGSTTVICTDKTGTLTENQMTVNEIYLYDRDIEVTGTGYKPEGIFKENDKEIDLKNDDLLNLFLKAGTLSSNASINNKDDLWEVVGDPTEGALVAAAMKANISKKELENNDFKRTGEVPFSSEKKFMAVSYSENEKEFTYLKGAPGVVLEKCDKVILKDNEVTELTEDIKEKLSNINHEMASEGLRVLGVAYKEKQKNSLEEDIEDNLIFLGFAGIMDPPRADVKESILTAQKAGIRTIMITGDQSDTAYAIAKKVGISQDNQKPITGSMLAKLSISELKEKIRTNSVFARVSPKDKLDIIDALNANNEITAMTGDGVNDAPALKKADIGVSMGQRGTAVAKEASDMVLLDDRFGTIVEAVKQGRVIFDNIQKFIHYLFSCNLSEILFLFLGIILQLPTPLLALQILWLNLVTDVFPALVMAWEQPEEGIMDKPPRDPAKAIMTNKFKLKIGLQGLVITFGPLLAYMYALNNFSTLESRTIGFMTIAFVQLFHVFNVRRENGLGFDRTLLQNKYLWGAIVLTIGLQLLAVYTPFLQNIIHTVALQPKMWYIVLIGSIAPVAILQLYSYVKNYLL
ncbi:MAG: cation-translocating P-type ATPase [Halanaerobiales bacterium]|nr:cation-translocating P-type ATPase [Halanaerobiales bacterium]